MLNPSAEPDTVTFETPALRGSLCCQGECHGLRAVEFAGNGARPINPSLYLGHVYRLLTEGSYLMTARERPHHGSYGSETVAIHWDPLPEHPAAIDAEYCVSGEQTIDFTVTVTPEGPLSKYELYLSNYFAPAWRPYVWLKSAPYLGQTHPVCWAPVVSEFIRGYYLAYPRDREATLTLFDGRWHGDHPVPFAVSREFATPVAAYASAYERCAVVVTARQDECFCIYSTYHTQDARDNILHHNSLYFGMFGENLGPGDTRTAHLRYHFVPWDTVSDLPLRLQAEFEAAGE